MLVWTAAMRRPGVWQTLLTRLKALNAGFRPLLWRFHVAFQLLGLLPLKSECPPAPERRSWFWSTNSLMDSKLKRGNSKRSSIRWKLIRCFAGWRINCGRPPRTVAELQSAADSGHRRTSSGVLTSRTTGLEKEIQTRDECRQTEFAEPFLELAEQGANVTKSPTKDA